MLQLIFLKNQFQISRQAYMLTKERVKRCLKANVKLLRLAVSKTVQNRIKSSQLHKILEEIVMNGKVAPEKFDEVMNNISNS